MGARNIEFPLDKTVVTLAMITPIMILDKCVKRKLLIMISFSVCTDQNCLDTKQL